MTEPSIPTSAPLVPRQGLILAGRYKLSKPIAAGGMAQVWRGYDEILDRNVAIKILHAHLAQDDKGFVTRFRREAVAAARLSHESIVAIYDTISTNKLEAIVMELIEGKTLRTLLNEQPTLPPDEIARIGIHICEALAEAHRYGIVHRDIKPANIILGPDRVMVTDFGIAKAGDDIDLTATGTLLGTAKYLAPEQVLGERIDPRSDLYSLGIVLYEAATGTVPFLADTDAATALKRLHRDPPKARSINSEVPSSLERLLDRSLAREADDRFRRATEFSAALQRLVADEDDELDIRGGEETAEFSPFTTTQAPLSTRSGSKPNRKAPRTTTDQKGSRRRKGNKSPANPYRSSTSSSKQSNRKPSQKYPTSGTVRRSTDRQRRRAREQSGNDASIKTSTGRDGPVRSWSAPAIAGLAVITGIVVGIAMLTRGGDSPDGETVSAPIEIQTVTDFDPFGDGKEKPNLKENAIDGERTSFWETEEYKRPDFGGGLKEGVGLVLEVDSSEIGSIEIDSETSEWSMEIFVGDSFGEDAEDWGPAVVTLNGETGSAKATLEDVPNGTKVLLWITDHGSTNGRNAFRLNEVIISP